MPIELLMVVIAKALTELAGMFLLGRGLLYVLAGRKRGGNMFYQVFCIVTDPLLRAARWITPRVIVDAHIPYVAFALVVWIWLAIVLGHATRATLSVLRFRQGKWRDIVVDIGPARA